MARLTTFTLMSALMGANPALAGAPMAEPQGVESNICETRSSAPATGSWDAAGNWASAVPDSAGLACFPSSADQRDTPGTWNAGDQRDPHYLPIASPRTRPFVIVEHAAGNPPTTAGACCQGSTCTEGDYFDCVVVNGGYFLEATDCTFNPCATGACCTGSPPSCGDDNGAGGPMDEELCDIRAGYYVGGATCDVDACQRVRLPDGFEIVEVSPGMEGFARRHPHLNNCGQIVTQIGSESSTWEADIYSYDNGMLQRITTDRASNVFPDVSDTGSITWHRGVLQSAPEVVLLQAGDLRILAETSPDEGESPRINVADHVVWSRRVSYSCPEPRRDAVYFYDSRSVRILFDDGLSNQSPAINDNDDLAWTRYHFPCGGEFEDWTSTIMLYRNGSPESLPSSVATPQGVAINNGTVLAWSASSLNQIEVWQNGSSNTATDPRSCCPALDARGDMAYNWHTSETPWQIWLQRDGSMYRLSNDKDIDDITDNSTADINESGEVTWKWNPNGGFTPSGTRYMRRVRDGDVNFDGVVDVGDFVPWPECWTGPVETDGLCECRFMDMDHDRDIDDDDFALFMRVYAGPKNDCNGNGTLDLRDLIDGTSVDRNLNGVPDECDLSGGTSADADGDGMPDEVCPGPVLETDTLGAKNRFLTVKPQRWAITPPMLEPNGFVRHPAVMSYAIRVSLVDVPAPFDEFSGTVMWAGAPRELCERAHQGLDVSPEDCGQVTGLPSQTVWVAPLVCDPAQAHYADWAELGEVHLYHQAVIPGGTYEVSSISQGCGLEYELNYSAPMTLGTTAQWGDTVSDCTTNPCGPPNGQVSLQDVLSLLFKFGNKPGAPTKVRVDLAGPGSGILDFRVDLSDVIPVLIAFSSGGYPFEPTVSPCP